MVATVKKAPNTDIREWAELGACRTSEVPSSWWYPDIYWSHRHPYIKAAIAVCQSCPVKQQCLDYALIHEPYGIWGGLSEQDRERKRRELNLPLLVWRK